MYVSPSHPFYRATAESVGGSSAPSVANASQVSPSNVTTSYPTPSPTGLGGDSNGVLDDEDMFGGNGDASEGESAGGGKPSGPKPFEEGFDPSSLDPASQALYKEAEERLKKSSASAPSRDMVDRLAQKAGAFDRLLANEKFQAWVKATEGGESDVPASDLTTIPGLSDLEPEAVKGLQEYIQSVVDREVASRVEPVSAAVWNREADHQINSLKTEIGAAKFDQLQAQATQYMEDISGLGIKEAFQLAEYGHLKAESKRREAETVSRKKNSVMEGDAGSSGVKPQGGEVKSARDAILLAMQQHKEGTAWDPRQLRG